MKTLEEEDEASPEFVIRDSELQIKLMRESLLSNQCSAVCYQEILLVDDQQFNLDVLQQMLQHIFKLGSTPVLTGRDAVLLFRMKLQQKCCKRVYRLVITDIQMPEMDGFELTK